VDRVYLFNVAANIKKNYYKMQKHKIYNSNNLFDQRILINYTDD